MNAADSNRERTLIRGGRVVTMDERGSETEGDVLIEGDTIVEVGPGIDAGDGASVIDAAGKIVIPGLIDSHRHTWQSSLHVVGPDWLEAEYLSTMRNLFGRVFRPEDLYVATLLGCAESIDGGITTLLDWAHLMNTPEHADAAVQALEDSGMRAVFAYGNSNAGFTLPNEIRLDGADAKRVRDEHFSSESLVSMALALRGPDYSDMEVTRDDFAVARDLGLPITVHVGSNGTYGRSVEKLHHAGLLGPDVTHVHCNTTLDEEMAMIADTGGLVSVSPEAEMHLGCGLAPVGRLVKHGIRPSISIDVPSVVATDLFGAMRVLLASHRGVLAQRNLDQPEEAAADPLSRLTTAEVLGFATVEGARATGMEGRTGRIEAGMQADITVIARDRPGSFPATSASADVVLASTPGDVDAVLVAGRALKRDGKLTTIDLDSLRRRVEDSREYLMSESGFRERNDG